MDGGFAEKPINTKLNKITIRREPTNMELTLPTINKSGSRTTNFLKDKLGMTEELKHDGRRKKSLGDNKRIYVLPKFKLSITRI